MVRMPCACLAAALVLIVLVSGRSWERVLQYALWWLRLVSGWLVGGLALFALSFQRQSLGVLVVPACAALWAVAPGWVQWWLQPQESLVAIALLGCLLCFSFYVVLPTVGCLLLPGVVVYWCRYGWSLEGVRGALSLGWLASGAPSYIGFAVEVLCKAVSCAACATLGALLVLPAVARLLHNARRPDRAHAEGGMDACRPVLAALGTSILGTVACSQMLEFLIKTAVCLVPVLAPLALALVLRADPPLPGRLRFLAGALSATLLGWWWADWHSLIQLVYAAGAVFTVLIGLTGDALTIALWRTDHREKWRTLRLMAGVWAALLWCGFRPALVEVLRCTIHLAAMVWRRGWTTGRAGLIGGTMHEWLVFGTIPVLLLSHFSRRVHRHASRKRDPRPPEAIRLELDFHQLPADPPDADDAFPPWRGPSTRRVQRIQEIREDLPDCVRVWKAAESGPPEEPPARGLGPWVLWELLQARSAGDVVAVVNELVHCNAKPRQRVPAAAIMHVDRADLFSSGLAQLQRLHASDLEARVLKVAYHQEVGQDYGGLRRDFFAQFARRLVDPAASGALFSRAPDNTLLPRPVLAGTAVDDEAYATVGRFLGLAIMQRHPVPVPLNRVVRKLLLGRPVTISDARALDPEFFHNRFEPLLLPDGVRMMEEWLCGPLTFVSAESPLRPVVVPLRPGGASERVTEATKHEYLQLLAQHHVLGGIEAQLVALLGGFHEVVPLPVLQHLQLTPGDLDLVLTGTAAADVQEWRAHTHVVAETPEKQQVVEWFWAAVGDMDAERRSQLLAFATGCVRLPAEGFSGLRFNLAFDIASNHLPSAHTCSQTLVLPLCRSETDLRRRLDVALRDVADVGFGFA